MSLREQGGRQSMGWGGEFVEAVVTQVGTDFPTYVVAAWEPTGDEHFWWTPDGGPGYVRWAVWALMDIKDGRYELHQKASRSCSEPTWSVDEAVRTAYGTVKWDGCCNFTVAESEDIGFDCALHTCGENDMRTMFQAIETAHRLASTMARVEP